MNEDRFEAEHGDLLQALRDARGDCPSPERLLDWVAGSLKGEDALSIESHVLLCSVCDEAVQRAREAEAMVDELRWRRADRRLAERNSPWRPARRSTRPAWFAAAAAAVVVLAVLLAVWPDPDRSAALPPVDTVRDAEIELYAPVGAVREPGEFRWRGIPAPVRYRVEVAEAGDPSRQIDPVWTRITLDTHLYPDPSLGAQLLPGGAYRWRVVVLDEEGQELSRSGWQDFILKD